jgi:hypothetical protein
LLSASCARVADKGRQRWLLIGGAAIGAAACTFLPQNPATMAAFIFRNQSSSWRRIARR